MAKISRPTGRPNHVANRGLHAPAGAWAGAPGYAELVAELTAAGDERPETSARWTIQARLQLWLRWADGDDPAEGLPTDRAWTPAQARRWWGRVQRRRTGWDDPEMHAWSSARRAVIRCPLTGQERIQTMATLWARGCACRTCRMRADGGDFASVAQRAGRPWLLDELLDDLDPRTISASDEAARQWRCPGCGEVQTASIRSRLESATGRLACPPCDTAARVLPGAPTTTLGAGPRPRGRAVRPAEVEAMRGTVLGIVMVPTLDVAPETSLTDIVVGEGVVTATVVRYDRAGAPVAEPGVQMPLAPVTTETWVRPEQVAHRGGHRVPARVARAVVRCDRHGTFSAPLTEVLDVLAAHGTTCRSCGFLAEQRAARPDESHADAADLSLADLVGVIGADGAAVLAAPRDAGLPSMVRPATRTTIDELLASPDPAERERGRVLDERRRRSQRG